MAERAKRRISAARTAMIVGMGGLVAGLGLGRGAETPKVDAAPARGQVITINGKYLKAGTIKYKALNLSDFQKHVYDKSAAGRHFYKLSDAKQFKVDFTNLATEFRKWTDIVLKLSDTDSLIKKLDTIYLKLTDASAQYLKITDAASQYLKLDATAKDAAKLGGVDPADITHGKGTVVTGSRLVNDVPSTLLEIPGNLRMQGSTPDQGKSATITVTNLSTTTISCNTPPGNGAPQNFSLAPQGSAAILIGLLQPAVVQCVKGVGDGASVHTFDISGFGEANNAVQIVVQGIIGPD